MSSKKQKEAKEEKKLPVFLGLEITNECPCGATVEIYERQELVYNPNKNKWDRICSKCLAGDKVFSAPKSSTSVGLAEALKPAPGV